MIEEDTWCQPLAFRSVCIPVHLFVLHSVCFAPTLFKQGAVPSVALCSAVWRVHLVLVLGSIAFTIYHTIQLDAQCDTV